MPDPIKPIATLPSQATPPAHSSSSSKFKLEVGTGADFNRNGRGGFNKILGKMVRQGRTTFSNVSGSDKKFIGDLISDHARKLPTGSTFSTGIKRDMKIKVEQARQGGKISPVDSVEFKKIIDNL